MNLIILPYIIFLLSLLGILLNRKSIILLLICIEIMLLSMTLNFLFCSIHQELLVNQISSVYIITIAAVESAIGLSIMITFYKINGSIALRFINTLKG